MTRFMIQTVETIIRCYHIEVDSTDAEAAIEAFSETEMEELERCLAYTDCHGEEIDRVEIMEKTQ